jgi:hypothetical protein
MFNDRRAWSEPNPSPVGIDAGGEIPVRHGAAEHQDSHGSPFDHPRKTTHAETFCSSLGRAEVGESIAKFAGHEQA